LPGVGFLCNVSVSFEIAYKLHTLVPLQVPSLFLIHEAVGYWWGLAQPRGFFGRVGWVGDGFCFGTEEDERVGWLYLSYETLMERGVSGWAGESGGGGV